MMKKFLITMSFILILSAAANAQSTQQALSELVQVYTGTEGSSGGLLGGFSMWGLIGGFLFGLIGMGVFIYGKKNSLFKPMLIGIILMVYPYFVRSTALLYGIGIALCAALYFF